VASLCLAFAAAAIKVLAERDSVFQITAVRSLIALPIFVPLSYYQTGDVVGPADNLKLVSFRGFCAAMAFLTGTLSTLLLPLSEASLYNNCHPAVLAVMVWLMRIESVDFLSWVGILGTLFSQVLIAQPPLLFGGSSQAWDVSRYLGIALSFISVVTKSLGFTLIGKIDKKVSSLVIANHAAFQLLLLSIPFLPTGYPKELDLNPSSQDVLLYVIGAGSALNQLFMVRSFQIGPPIKAAMLSLVRILMMMALGVIVCSEEITPLHAVGAFLMLSFISLVIWRKNKLKQSKAPPIVESVPYESLPQTSPQSETRL